MATRRTDIQVVVLGLSDLQALNTALNVHDKRLQGLTASYLAFNAAVSGASGGMKQFITNNVTTNNTLNQTDNTLRNATISITKMGAAANSSGAQFGGMLGKMLQYRAVSAVFEGVQKTIAATVQAMMDLEKQTARVQRVSAPGSSRGISMDIGAEQARTGADVKDIGEAYYQLKTQVKDNATAFGALQTAMNLVVGTESDARDTARAMLQVYNQFGDQLGKNVDQNEKLRRSGELLATMWKGSAAEISEITAALKYLGPVAESAHVPLEQVAAVLSALTFEGVRGRMGGTEAAQLIAQMIKNFDLATGYIKNKGATLKAGLTPEGGLDFVQTMKNFNEVASHMPTATAEKFSQAISGSMNAWRLFGTVNPEFLRVLQEKLDEATKATHGLTHETDDLRKTMMTTEQEGKRAWGGLMDYIALTIDQSPLREWLKGLADAAQHAIEGLRLVTQFQHGQETYTNNVFAPGAPVRPAVEQLQSTVRQALAKYRSDPVMADLDFVTDGMTPAEKTQIRQRYQRNNHGIVSIDSEAMARDLGIMMRQLSDPNFGIRPSALNPSQVQPFDPFSPGTRRTGLPGFGSGKNLGGYNPEKDDEAQKLADEAAQKRLEKLRDDYNKANASFRISMDFAGPDDPETIKAATKAANLKKQIADAEHDAATKMLVNAGLEGEVADRKAASIKKREDADKEAERKGEENRKEYAASTDYYAELARDKYGLFSPATRQFVAEAQKAAIGAADDPIDILKLKAGAMGPSKVQYDLEREAAKARDDAEQERQKAAAQASQDLFESARTANENLRQSYSGVADDLAGPTEQRMRTRQFGLRPNAIGGGADQRQSAMLEANVADISKLIDLLTKFVPEATDKISEWKDRLEQARAALVDFHDTLDQKAYSKRVQADQDAYELRNQDIEHLHRLKFNKDESAAHGDALRKYQELVASAEENLATVVKHPLTEKYDEEVRKAKKDVTEAQQNLTDYKIDAAIQKYQNIRGAVQTTVHGAVSNFLHGQGDLGTVAKSIGDTIVNAAMDKFIKQWTDPLVQTVTNQILAIESNTKALDFLNSTMGGGASGGGGVSGSATSLAASGLGAVVAAGVTVGIAQAAADGEIGGGVQGGAAGAGDAAHPGAAGSVKQSDLQKGVGAALAAYSIGATSAQQGINVGNVLGGAVTGASIGATFGGAGALIGAGVGVVADLIGGIFHQNQTPTQTPQNLNPAYYNAPSNFDVAAYNYSAYGKLPTVQDVGFTVNPQNVPTINVFVDGAKVAAQVEIGKQASLVSVSLNSPYLDRHTPV